MNQAVADFPTTEATHPGQANAGVEGAAGYPSEASASVAGSNDTPMGHPGAAVPGDPGRAVDLDIVDESHADIESYLRDLEQFGAGELPESLTLDPEAPENRPDFEPEIVAAPVQPAPVVPVAPAAPAQVAPPVDPAKPPQYRLQPTTDVDARAFAILKADQALGAESQGLNLETALKMAKVSLGLPPDEPVAAAASAAPAAEPEPDPVAALPEGAPRTVAEANASLRTLRRELLTAREDLDLDRQIEIERQILDLEETIPVIQEAEAHRSEQAALEEAQWRAAAQASLAAVVAQYPAAADPNSAVRQRMDQIDEAWGDAGDARYDHADKAEKLFAIVAKEFGLVPAASPAPAPAPTAGVGGRVLPTTVPMSPSAPRPGSPVPIASGAARTSTPGSLSSAVVARAEQIDDPMAYMEFLDSLNAGQ